MQKKVSNYCLVIGLSSFCSSLMSMHQEVPVLSINNYIVNVPSAYEGLKKEVAIMNDTMRSIGFEIKNRDLRIKQKYPVLYRIPAQYSYLKNSRSHISPKFFHIKVVYKRSLQPEQPDEPFETRLHIIPQIYFFKNVKKLKTIPFEENIELMNSKPWEWLVGLLQEVIQKTINSGYQGRYYCVELYHNKRISDLLIIKNALQQDSFEDQMNAKLRRTETIILPEEESILYDAWSINDPVNDIVAQPVQRKIHPCSFISGAMVVIAIVMGLSFYTA